MRTLSVNLLVVALLAAVGSPVEAQNGLRGPGGAIGGFHLIAMPAVQQELQLNDVQVAKARAVAARMNARFEQDMGKMKGLSEEEKGKRAVTLAGPHYQEGMRELRSFLTPAQVERFDQILFQQRGPMAMLEPKVVESMQVTNDLAHKVAAIVAQTQNEQRAAIQAAGNKPGAAAAKVEAIAAASSEKVIELLSPEQKRTWERLTGKPFRPDLSGGEGTAAAAAAPPTRP